MCQFSSIHENWGRTQQVLLEGVNSSTAPVQSGVPQGSVLGPLLFLLFINDLPDAVSEGSAVRLFADDCALYRDIKSAADAIQLQEDLNNSRSESYSVLSPFLSKLRYAYRRNRQNLLYLLVYFKFESEIAVKS